ncbi:hypothetical protein RHGRI_026964 [Rhododendron griersonianum]|uniref:HXXXD-type acyl-transferase family protein n=1 Tax=Rhododendron griersonianum TaxID=479676 RepID=A0AAV6IYE0_9ERIC|nr:hypothetical protein RHGRI_026964 [Rhododendron griersonianum]
MAEVRSISTTTVRTASPVGESVDRIELTPWDLQLLSLGPIQKGLLFLKPTPSQQEQLQRSTTTTTIVDHLKSSFSHALDFFPPLAGRLGITEHDDSTSSFFIDCNNAGADFIHAVVDNVTVGDVLDPIYVPRIVHSFFPLNGLPNYEGISKPLLAVQLTELVDGFFIGCTMNHAVVDGSSFWNFINSWSEISRGSHSISRPPVFDRWFPTGVGCPIRIPFTLKEMQDTFFPPSLEERVFHFTKAKIAALKAKANSETGTSTISSLQALLAHLWVSVVRCQSISSEQEVRYTLLISARGRLKNPSLPEGYFGNTVHPTAIANTAGELLEKGVGRAALEMNKAIALQTSDEVRNFWKCWLENPKLLKMDAFTKNGLATSSSPRFDMYGNDFGWGKPVAVQCGSANKNDGKMTLFPGVEEGSIDVEVCLAPEKLVSLGEDKEFMEAVTI